MTSNVIGILNAAAWLPTATRDIANIFASEGITLTAEIREQLGVEQVHCFEGDSPTEMAVAAAREVLEEARLKPTELQAIIDFSTMPQRYVEPAWSMSNELQAELGAKSAFTLGYSGGGMSNLHVALKFAIGLIKGNEDVDTILLVGADRAIPGNRVISAPDPVSVIGDGASALIVTCRGPEDAIIGTHAQTNGANHDILNIPGGGIKHPTALDRYRLTIDTEKFAAVNAPALARQAGENLMRELNGSGGEIDHHIGANFSRSDVMAFQPDGGNASGIALDTLSRCGHMHANDLVFNYLALKQAGVEAGARVLLASHGLGFTAGATLLET